MNNARPPTYPELLPTSYENTDIPVGEGDLSEAAADELCATKFGFKYVKRNVIRTGNWVGALSAKGQTVEVMPKLEGPGEVGKVDLVGMLQSAKVLPRNIRRTKLAGGQRDSLLDFIAESYARDVTREATRGLERRYVRKEEVLARPRGRIEFSIQAQLDAVGTVGMACIYDELLHDTPLNRLLKAGLLAAKRKVRSGAASARIRQALELFADVPTTRISAKEAESLLLTRQTMRFEHLKEISVLFLEKLNPDARLSDQRHASYSFMWEMFRVFEYAVLHGLKSHMKLGQIVGQGIARRLGHNLSTSKSVGEMKPDLLIRPIDAGNGRLVIADTKWKRADVGSNSYGCDRDDLYQMLTYAEMHPDALGRNPHLALIYPTLDKEAQCLIGTLMIGHNSSVRLDVCRTYVGLDGQVDCRKLAEHLRLLAQA